MQETWLAVLEGIDRFEARSSLKTWIHQILTNRAKTRAQREHRQLPFSALSDDDEPEVNEARFRPVDDPKFPQQWAAPPRAWPHDRLLARETVDQLRIALAQLPPAQQVIVGLRDIEGWSSGEVCDALEITPGNQRVLLHRARSRLRNSDANNVGPALAEGTAHARRSSSRSRPAAHAVGGSEGLSPRTGSAFPARLRSGST